MSGRWGCRPLWRGGWRVLDQKFSLSRIHPERRAVLLRSPAEERHTGARSQRSFRPSRSQTQLPITSAILQGRQEDVSSSLDTFGLVLSASRNWYFAPAGYGSTLAASLRYAGKTMHDLGYFREHLDEFAEMAKKRNTTLDLDGFQALD